MRIQLLRFITCGNVDDGKSTLIGRLLHDSKGIFEDQLENIKKDSKKNNSTAARLKLKGIDGDPHKRWVMWINSMQREKPYLPLTCLGPC